MKTAGGFGAVALALVACGGAGAPAADGSVVVPAQPVRPVASATAGAEDAGARAAAKAAVAAFRCETGQRFERNGRSYCAYSEPLPWLDSERRCVANGGHLMTLDTEKKSMAVHDALGSPVHAGRAAWIGLELKGKAKPPAGSGTAGSTTGTARGVVPKLQVLPPAGQPSRPPPPPPIARPTPMASGTWTWLSGEALTSSRWNAGEPNDFDGNEACGEWLVANGRWNDTRCSLAQAYLCQAKGKLACPADAAQAFTLGGTNYCYHGKDLTFENAKRACASDGGALAQPKTAEEQEALRGSFSARFTATRMWIGLSDADDEGHWRWVTGDAFDFERWADHEPNDFEDEDCAELHADTWKWNDMSCEKPLPSVCESAAP